MILMEEDTVMTYSEVQEELSHIEVDMCELDPSGQLVRFTGIYQWRDGTFHTTPETPMVP